MLMRFLKKTKFHFLIIYLLFFFQCKESVENKRSKNSDPITASSEAEKILENAGEESSVDSSGTSSQSTETEASATNESLGVYVNAVDGAISGMDINKIKLKIREFSGFESNSYGVLLGGPKIKIETVNQDTSEVIDNNIFGDNLKTTIEVRTEEINAAGKNLAIAVRENINGNASPVKIIPPSSIVWQKINDEKSLVSFPVAGSDVDIQLLKLETEMLSSAVVYVPRPPEPRGLSCRGETASKIKLSWGNPGGVVAAYKIVYATLPDTINSKIACETGTEIDDIPGTANEYSVDSLSASTNYTFRLCSKNNSYPTPDISPGSTCTTSTTAPNIPVYHVTMNSEAYAVRTLSYFSGTGDVLDAAPTVIDIKDVHGTFGASSFFIDHEGKPNISSVEGANDRMRQFKKGNSWETIRNVTFPFMQQNNPQDPTLPYFEYSSFSAIAFGSDTLNLLAFQKQLPTYQYEIFKLISDDSWATYKLLDQYPEDYYNELTPFGLLKDNNNTIHWFGLGYVPNQSNPMITHHSTDSSNNYQRELFTNTSCNNYAINTKTSVRGLVDQNGKIHLAYLCFDSGSNNRVYISNNKNGTWEHHLIKQYNPSAQEPYISNLQSFNINRAGDKAVVSIGVGGTAEFVIYKLNQDGSSSPIAVLGTEEYSGIGNACYEASAFEIAYCDANAKGAAVSAMDYDGYIHIFYTSYSSTLGILLTHLHNRSGNWVKIDHQNYLNFPVSNNVGAGSFEEFMIEGMPTRSYRP